MPAARDPFEPPVSEAPVWALPNRLTVGVVAGSYHGGGHLRVAPGDLVCELGPIARRIAGLDEVLHVHRDVHVFRAKLVPFWFNVTAVIDDGHVAVLASRSTFALKMLVATLRRAGFEVVVHKTWADRGRSLGDPVRTST